MLAGGPLDWGGALGNVAMLYSPGGFPTLSGGAPSTTALASLCKKQTDLRDFRRDERLHGSLSLSPERSGPLGGFEACGRGLLTSAARVAAQRRRSMCRRLNTGPLPRAGTIAGPGVPGCPLACPTCPSGPALTCSELTIAAGYRLKRIARGDDRWHTYKPATPNRLRDTFNGYISSNTLTVTSIGTGSGYARLHRVARDESFTGICFNRRRVDGYSARPPALRRLGNRDDDHRRGRRRQEKLSPRLGRPLALAAHTT